MKLCCSKQILSSSHYNKPHFAVAAEELDQAPSSLSGSESTYQVTPLTQVMLSTFLWLLFASGQGYRQRCFNLSFGLCLLLAGKHEPQDSLPLSLLNSKKMFGSEFGFNSSNNSVRRLFQHSEINLFALKFRVLILKTLRVSVCHSTNILNQSTQHGEGYNTSHINSRYI